MNYHLANSPAYQSSAAKGKKITNFSGDIKDSIAYACLLEQIQPIDEDTKEYELIPPLNSNNTLKVVIQKSNFHYTRGNTPKRITSGGIHLRGLAPGQHSSEDTSQRWRAVGDTVSDSTAP